MHFTYCPDCGSELSERDLGDETGVPWCDKCAKPWFDVFPSAIIALVHDGHGNVLLLRQKYISEQFCNLVSGYIKPGESAEETALREILEETGQKVVALEPVCTNWFEKKEMMMIGFFARVEPRPLELSVEVDDAFWVKAEDAPALVHQRPQSTSRILCLEFLKRRDGYATLQAPDKCAGTGQP